MKLGDRIRERITGFEGICFGKTEYLTGCRHVCISPESCDDKGKPKEAEWFDENRCEVVVEAAIAVHATGPDTGTGGPIACLPPTNP